MTDEEQLLEKRGLPGHAGWLQEMEDKFNKLVGRQANDEKLQEKCAGHQFTSIVNIRWPLDGQCPSGLSEDEM